MVGSMQYNDDYYKNWLLQNSNITSIETYNGSKTKIGHKCLVCNYIWGVRPCDVMNKEYRCPRCSNHIPITMDIVKNKIERRNIEIKSLNILHTKDLLEWKCKICDSLWKASYNSICVQQTGCPDCGRKSSGKTRQLPVEEYLKRISTRKDISYISGYGGLHKKCLHLCVNTNKEWLTTPNDILGGHGSPFTFRRGENITYDKLLKKYEVKRPYRVKLEDIYQLGNKTNTIIFDFYLPEINTIVEFDGHQHYKPTRLFGISQDKANKNYEKQTIRDSIRVKYCLDKNINLIIIDGRYNNIEQLPKIVENGLRSIL
jgi:hypothetical protein